MVQKIVPVYSNQLSQNMTIFLSAAFERDLLNYSEHYICLGVWALVGTRARVQARAWARTKAGYVVGPEVMGDFI